MNVYGVSKHVTKKPHNLRDEYGLVTPRLCKSCFERLVRLEAGIVTEEKLAGERNHVISYDPDEAEYLSAGDEKQEN